MKKNKLYIFLFTHLVFLNCQKSNLFKDKNDLERADVLFQKSQLYYDNGDYTKAMEMASKVKILSPDTEKNNLNLVNIHLALAGEGLLDMMKKIIKQQDKEKKENISSTSDLLKSFSEVFSLSQEDQDQLATKDISETTNSFFSGLDLYIPKIPGDISDASTPRSQVFTLKKISETIKEACPYITDEKVLKEQGKSTNSRYSCEKVKTVKNPAQFYFSYAIAHLIEAIQFYSILLYETPGLLPITNDPEIKGNLARRAKKIKDTDVNADNMAEYIQAVALIKTDSDKILDTTNPNSMISETIRNFKIAAKSFAAIPGLPSEVSKSIEEQMKKLDETASSAGAAKSDTDVFKAQMSENLANQVKTSIDNLDRSKVSDADLKTICDSFASLSIGMSITKPAKCSSI